MDWLLSIVRVAGASFPVASSFVQLQSEIDSKSLLERVSKLEDPVSHLHQDVPEISRLIYQKLNSSNGNLVKLDEGVYKKYSRPLAVLEAQGCIKGGHAIGKSFVAGIRLVDHTYEVSERKFIT